MPPGCWLFTPVVPYTSYIMAFTLVITAVLSIAIAEWWRRRRLSEAVMDNYASKAACALLVLFTTILLTDLFNFSGLKYERVHERAYNVPVYDAGQKTGPSTFSYQPNEKLSDNSLLTHAADMLAGGLRNYRPAGLDISCYIRPDSFKNREVIFQTAPGGAGLRVETGPEGSLSLIYMNSGKGEPIEAEYKRKLIPGHKHALRIRLWPDKRFYAKVDGEEWVLDARHLEMELGISKISVGKGLENGRPFSGRIEDFRMSAGTYKISGAYLLAEAAGSLIKVFLGALALALLQLTLLKPPASGPEEYRPGNRAIALSVIILSLYSCVRYIQVPEFTDSYFYIWGLPFIILSLAATLVAQHKWRLGWLVPAAVILYFGGLTGRLFPFAVTLTLMAASYGLGDYICRIFKVTGDDRPLLIPLTLGVAVNGIAAWVAMRFQVNYTCTHAFVMLTELVLVHKPVLQLLSGALHNPRPRLSSGQTALVAFAAVTAGYAFMSRIGFDGIAAHLYIPKVVSLFGYFDFNPEYSYGLDHAIIPKGIYTSLFLTGGETTVKIFGFLVFLCSFFALEGLARKRFGERTAFWTTLTAILFPMVVWQISLVLLDCFELAFGVLALELYFRTRDDMTGRNMALFFISLPLAYYGKQCNVILGIPLALDLTLRTIREAWNGRWRPMATFLACMPLAPMLLAPIFAWSYIKTGNPVFPNFSNVFKSIYFSLNFPYQMSPKMDPWSQLVDITFNGMAARYYAWYQAGFGSLFFSLLPAALFIPLFNSRGRREHIELFLIFLLSSAMFLYLLPPQLRYFTSCLPLGAMVLGMTTDRLFSVTREAWLRTALGTALITTAVINTVALFQNPRDTMHYPFGDRWSKPAVYILVFEEEGEPCKAAFGFANKQYGKYSKGLSYSAPGIYFSDTRIELDDWYSFRTKEIISAAKTPLVLFDLLFYKKRFDYVIITDRQTTGNLCRLRDEGFLKEDFRIKGFGVYRPDFNAYEAAKRLRNKNRKENP